MRILKKVYIKQIVTEQSKTKLFNTFATKKEQLERECQQLLFEKRKMKNKLTMSESEIEKRFGAEVEHRTKQIEQIEFQLEQLNILEIGSEIVEKEVKGITEVSVGDNWKDINTTQSIVVKDGIVIRID